MNRKRNHPYRLLLSSIIILAALGMSFLFYTKSETPSWNLPETEANASAEKLIPEETASEINSTAEHISEAAGTETEGETQLTAEAFSEREYERILALSAGELATTGKIASQQINRLFFAAEVSDAVFARINGASYTENDNIKLSDLSYLRMLYYGFDGNTYVGEMIVNQKIESDVLLIFKTLYENEYPIEKMVLIDEYNADDEASMEANNTSAFNYRTISGSSKLSNHSYGMAIDLNPKYNPYVRTSADGSILCQPESGREYADRSKDFAYKIDENDLAYRLFTEAGFTWGGNWNSVKDYQHFEK